MHLTMFSTMYEWTIVDIVEFIPQLILDYQMLMQSRIKSL